MVENGKRCVYTIIGLLLLSLAAFLLWLLLVRGRSNINNNAYIEWHRDIRTGTVSVRYSINNAATATDHLEVWL